MRCYTYNGITGNRKFNRHWQNCPILDSPTPPTPQWYPPSPSTKTWSLALRTSKSGTYSGQTCHYPSWQSGARIGSGTTRYQVALISLNTGSGNDSWDYASSTSDYAILVNGYGGVSGASDGTTYNEPYFSNNGYGATRKADHDLRLTIDLNVAASITFIANSPVITGYTFRTTASIQYIVVDKDDSTNYIIGSIGSLNYDSTGSYSMYFSITDPTAWSNGVVPSEYYIYKRNGASQIQVYANFARTSGTNYIKNLSGTQAVTLTLEEV